MPDGDVTIEEIEGLMQEEDGQLKKGAEQHDEAQVRDAGKKLDRIVVLDNKYFFSLESKIEGANGNLMREVNEIEDLIGGPESFDEPLNRLKNVQTFMDELKEKVEDDDKRIPTPGGLIEGEDDIPGSDRYFSVNGSPYGIEDANDDIKHISEVDLNPLSEQINPKDEAVELENLKKQIKETVEVHQRLNEFKRLLKLALEDEELLEEYAESDGLSELENSGEELRERTNKLKERVQELEEKEKETINLLERAHKIISNRIEFDQSVLESFQDNIGEKGGGLFSSPEGYRKVIQELRDVFDESSIIPGKGTSLEELIPELYKELNRLEDNLESLEKASQILSDYSKEEQEIYNINQAIEGYIQAHQDLFSESDDTDADQDLFSESDDSDEHMAPNTQMFDTQGYNPNNDPVPDEVVRAPDGFDKSFFEIVNKLDSHNPPRELIEGLNVTQERFEQIHRLDEEDEEGIREFEEHLSSAETKLKELKANAKRFADDDSSSTKAATKLSSEHLEKLFEGERDKPGLKDVSDEVEALQRNLGFLYTHEDNERATFHSIKNDLQEELERVNKYIQLFNSYKEMKNRLVRKKWSDGSAWELAVKYVSYKLFMQDPDIPDLDEAMDEFKLMVKSHKGAYNELESRVEEIEGLLEQEIKIREDEINEMQDSLEDLDNFRDEFINTIHDVDNVTDDIPDGLTKVLDKIDTKLGKIEEKLGKIEEAKESDDTEMEHIIESMEAADDGSDT